MILVDVNLLVYAGLDFAPQHQTATAWLDRQLSGEARVGLPWPCLLGYLRIATSARILKHPAPTDVAWAQVKSWIGSGPAWIPEPTERHAGILDGLLAQPGIVGNLIPDAHLAALAIEHGLTLCSTDGDFARFKGLRWVNPLGP